MSAPLLPERLTTPPPQDATQYEYTIELLIELLRDLENEPEFPADVELTEMTFLNRQESFAHLKNLVKKALKREFAIEEERKKEAENLLLEAVRARFANNQEDKYYVQCKVDVACMKAHALLNDDSALKFRFSVWEVMGSGLKLAVWCKQRYPCSHSVLKFFTFAFPSRLYYNSVRLRIGFFGFITCVLVFTGQSGILIETFMSVFTPLTEFNDSGMLSQQDLYFILLPLLLCLSAYFLEGLLEISMDATQAIPLVNWQAAFLQGLKFLTWPRFFTWLLWFTSTGAFLASFYFSSTPGVDRCHLLSYRIQLSSTTLLSMLLISFVFFIVFSRYAPDDYKFALGELKEGFTARATWQDCMQSTASIFYVVLIVASPLWACHTSAFPTFALALILTFVQKNRKEPQYHFPFKWERRIVDVTGFVLLEVIPLSNAIRGAYLFGDAPDGRGVRGAFIRSLFWGAVCCICIATSILQASVACISVTSSKLWQTRAFCGCKSTGRIVLPAAESKEYYQRWSFLFRRKGVAPGMLTHMHRKLFQVDDEKPDLGRRTVGVSEYQYHVQGRWAKTSLWSGLWALITGALFAYVLFLVQHRLPVPSMISMVYLFLIEALILSAAYDVYRFYAVDNCEFPASHFEKGCTIQEQYILLCVAKACVIFLISYFLTWQATTLKGIVMCTLFLASALIGVCNLSNAIPARLQIEIPRIFELLGAWMIWIGASIFAYQTGKDAMNNAAYFLCPAFLVTALGTSSSFAAVFPGSVGRVYWWLSSAFYVLFGALLVSQAFEVSPFGAQVTINETATTTSYMQDYVNVVRDPSFQYGLCDYRYGSEGAQLTALDLAQLAGLTYEKERSLMHGNLSLLFNGTYRSAKIVHWTDYKVLPRPIVFDIKAAGSNNVTRVIAFKGSSTTEDFQTDVMLFSAIKVLQLIGHALPVIDLFSEDQIQWFLYVAHLPAQRLAETSFFSQMEDELRGHINAVDRVILTGHSLGGAFAQIMAARLNLPAVVFSSPGVLYSADRFGIHQRAYWWDGVFRHTEPNDSKETFKFGVQVLKSKVRNVIPQYDFVPGADGQMCLVEPIQCRKRAGLFGNAAMCHSLKKTSCEVWRRCGDPYGRIHDCGKFFSPSEINQWDSPDDFKKF